MSLFKKIFIISGSIFLILIFLWGIYKVAFEKKSETAVLPTVVEKNLQSKQPTEIEEKSSPEKNDLPLYAISNESVISPIIGADEKSIKYYSSNGTVSQIDFYGKNKFSISDRILEGFSRAIWSPDKSKVISVFSSENAKVFSYFNYETKESASLNKNISAISWQSDSRIAYFYSDKTTNTKNISVANANGSDWKKITDITFDNIFLSAVPKTGMISFWNLPDAFSESSFSTILPAENSPSKVIFSGKFGADYLWSPDGTKILVSHLDEKGGKKLQLAIINVNGGEYSNLSIPTIVSKCVWSQNGKYIYYALPNSIPENAQMPNDYFAKKFKTTDTFWVIDVTTGKKTRLLELEEMKNLPSVDAINLFLDKNASALFFINREDEKLYRLSL